MAFRTVLDPRAMQDIQEAIDYYDEQEAGLGEVFEEAVNQHLSKFPSFRTSSSQRLVGTSRFQCAATQPPNKVTGMRPPIPK